jgi:bacteriocin-like protein
MKISYLVRRPTQEMAMSNTRNNDAMIQLSDEELNSVSGGDNASPLQTMGTDKAKTATKEAEKLTAFLRG